MFSGPLKEELITLKEEYDYAVLRYKQAIFDWKIACDLKLPKKRVKRDLEEINFRREERNKAYRSLVRISV